MSKLTQAELDAGNELTREHIALVQKIMGHLIKNFQRRAEVHDLSKLESPEAEVLAEFGPKLKGSTYDPTPGSVYHGFLAEMKPALDHHYASNSHHPEFHKDGIDGMDLLDLLEMAVDWFAAGKRHADGSFEKSLEMNTKRFNLSDQVVHILRNTAPLLEGAITKGELDGAEKDKEEVQEDPSWREVQEEG